MRRVQRVKAERCARSLRPNLGAPWSRNAWIRMAACVREIAGYYYVRIISREEHPRKRETVDFTNQRYRPRDRRDRRKVSWPNRRERFQRYPEKESLANEEKNKFGTNGRRGKRPRSLETTKERGIPIRSWGKVTKRDNDRGAVTMQS